MSPGGGVVTAPRTIALGDLASATDELVAALAAGGLVVVPTDTVYGLAALPTDADAIDSLFAMKGRGADVPLAVLCADVDQALTTVVAEAVPRVERVAARWWPGPLTLVVPRRPGARLHLGEPSSTIGLRVPAHDLVRAVAAAVGPIAATSANPHGQPPPTTAAEAARSLGPGLALLVDGGPLGVRSSTVVDLTDDPWRVLRDGPIPGDEVIAVADANHGSGQ